MSTDKKNPETEKLLGTVESRRKDANQARWLKAKRSSTEQSIMDAGRQPGE